jgi:hypothetical protein
MYKYDRWLTHEGLARIQGWARDGLIDKEIAHNMSIGISTLRLWKNKFPEIENALNQGKDAADRIVENALYQSAIGYRVKVQKPVRVRHIEYDPVSGKKIGETESWQTVEEEIYVQPQVTAQIFWLKNRKPEQWRDRTDMMVAPTNGVLESLLELKRGE